MLAFVVSVILFYLNLFSCCPIFSSARVFMIMVNFSCFSCNFISLAVIIQFFLLLIGNFDILLVFDTVDLLF